MFSQSCHVLPGGRSVTKSPSPAWLGHVGCPFVIWTSWGCRSFPFIHELYVFSSGLIFWRKTIVTLHDITKWHDIASNVQVYTLFTVYRFGPNVSRPRTQKTIFISGRWTVWVYHSLPVVERWTTRQNWIELVPATQIVLALVLQQQGTEPFGYIVTVHVYRKYKLDVVQQFGYCCDLSENYLLAILLHFGDPGYVGVDLVSTLPIKVVKFDPRTSRAKVERAMNPCHEESLDVF